VIDKPTYKLDLLGSHVKAGTFNATLRETRSLINHGYNPESTIRDILQTIVDGRGSFKKSVKLKEAYADVYTVFALGQDWYVKFYITDEVLVLSCKYDSGGW